MDTRCVICGGGPAGMMLGVLLARAGVKVVVLEKHQDFLRDFRGDTVHPSTMQILHELGWLTEFLKRPHQKAEEVSAFFGDKPYKVADFRHLPTVAKFIALMPQWDFLDFLAERGRQYETFTLKMNAKVTHLIREGQRIVGVKGTSPEGEFEYRTDLVVAADGRGSILREQAKLEILNQGAPIDVLWMRIPRLNTDPDELRGRFAPGALFIMIMRGDYWQCAMIIPKDGFSKVKEKGLEALKERLVAFEHLFKDRVDALKTWEDVKLLTVKVDRLKEWYRDGFLCIGDSAHAMSPIAGVGVNLAIQDAVAAANILSEPLKNKSLGVADLAKIQKRREFPTKVIQFIQVTIQERFLKRVLSSAEDIKPPLLIRLVSLVPFLARFPARIPAVGLRSEHLS
jgi:2-polyprenyl-6-methoxyphenol hydroxylase-like FAD-dependent oxidoreductase